MRLLRSTLPSLMLLALAEPVVLIATPHEAHAQQPTRRVLTKAAVEFAEPFTSVSSVRELRDGRVVVADGRDKIVQIVDFGAGRTTRVGREGSGPAEYLLPTRLYAVGDSTWLLDPGNDRLLVLGATGTPRGTRPIEMGSLSGTLGLRGVDARGRLIVRARAGAVVNGEDTDEWLLRVPGVSRGVDTIARLVLPRGRHTGATNVGGGMLRLMNDKPYAHEDIAAVAPDGRVAVVRSATYQVEWYLPDGKRVTGAPVRYTPLAVSRAEKQAFLKRQLVPGAITTSGNAGGRSGKVLPRGSEAPDPGDINAFQWPATMPPFAAGAATVASDGTLWVLRTRAHDDPVPSYDVFDATSRHTGRVLLPPRTRLVGFGNRVAYLVRLDDDDLEYLGRYML
ncbi:MAG: hypothetical protein V4617_08250 [Gemmatimonadota bacterium]